MTDQDKARDMIEKSFIRAEEEFMELDPGSGKLPSEQLDELDRILDEGAKEDERVSKGVVFTGTAWAGYAGVFRSHLKHYHVTIVNPNRIPWRREAAQ